MEKIHTGRRPDGTRAPRRIESKRTCAKKGCGTRLSSYNRREYCHVHAPTRFPRVRGRNGPPKDN